MSREVCKHGNRLESPCYYCQTKPPFSSVIAAKDARIAELEAAIARDMGGDYMSLQALYVRQIATLAQRDTRIAELENPVCLCELGAEADPACSYHGIGSPDHLAVLEVRIAQRDREVLALRKALEHMGRCAYCAEDSWEDCEGGRQALATLASTGQAADEAERRILEAAWERVQAESMRLCGCRSSVWIEAAILGTESGEATHGNRD